MEEYYPLVSIIIPTRNEAADIRRTLEACLALRYEPKEIIVVDDSSDDTPQIVESYAGRGVRLIHRERNENGCCGARNVGMKAARGEILVLLNADALPRPDFIERILPHYRVGADYLIVQSVVNNRENFWGNYVWVTSQQYFSSDPDMEWSEGFSCRKLAAQQVGYIPGDFPIPFCRDYMFGMALNRAGFCKRIDLSIPMEHISPGNLKDYWLNQVWRGTFSAPTAFYFWKKSPATILMRELLKLGRTLASYVFLVPALWRTAELVRYAPDGWKAYPGLFYAGLIRDIATHVGNFRGLRRVLRLQSEQQKEPAAI